MAIFTGAGVAIVTPMNQDGSVNYEKFAELIKSFGNEKINVEVLRYHEFSFAGSRAGGLCGGGKERPEVRCGCSHRQRFWCMPYAGQRGAGIVHPHFHSGQCDEHANRPAPA